MCDEQILSGMGKVNRRDFGRIGMAAGAGVVAAGSSSAAMAQSSLVETEVSFDAPGGRMDGFFFHPQEGRHPGVILWPDIAGIRDAKLAMARNLASEGYAVLVANPYYRSVAGEQFADFDAWRADGGFAAVRPWMELNTPEAVAETAQAIVSWLDERDAVDSTRGIGAQGYCMTGSWTIRAAAAVPGRVKAAASFHGGGLVGEEPTSPVNLLAAMADDASLLVAIARNDDANAPDDKDALRAAADAAGLAAEIEVYNGDHGWTVYDSPVYDYDEEDRATANLLELYRAAL